ncbi:MAG TPA: hypothetical protein VFN23_13975 [Ktedonobacteraceae bacterium]|nr:hypothetical protein [Ktedonobacteraceae bacterium]
MSSNTFSVMVKCWYNTESETTHLQVIRTDTSTEVQLSNSTFLLRMQEVGPVERCYIRHIASGRDAYVQGGPGLRNFITTCLLNGSSPEAENPGSAGENTSTL